MKNKSIVKYTAVFLIFISVILVCIFLKLFEYKIYTSDCRKNINYCSKLENNHYFTDEIVEFGEDKCYEKMYHLMLPKLLVYKVSKNNKPVTIYKASNTFSILHDALISSDALLSWGVGNENQIMFEASVVKKYDTPLYIFDCGMSEDVADKIQKKLKRQNIYLQSECLGTDKYLMFNQKSSNKIHSFAQKLKELNLEDKKVYLKLGIPEPQEYIEDILKHKDNITAISTSVDIWSPKHCLSYIKFFNALDNDFVLISRNIVEKNKDTKFPKIKYLKNRFALHISLLYVNKKFIDSYYLPLNQSNSVTGHAEQILNERPFAPTCVDCTVALFEKIRLFKSRFKK